MSDGIYSALSGAIAQQRALDTVANNVANVGTVGFRGDSLAFREAVSRAERGPTPDGLRYVEVSRVATDETNGPLTQTGNPLDVAVQGDGLFAVRTEDGVRYTRAGSFRMDSEGILRTAGGHVVLPAEGDEIRIPPDATNLQVGTDGTISAGDTVVGRFRVQRFESGQLEKEGLTLYAARGGAEGTPMDTETTINQGYLEGANVSPVSGMNELITASRSFEAFQRVIQAFKQIDERAARDVGSGR